MLVACWPCSFVPLQAVKEKLSKGSALLCFSLSNSLSSVRLQTYEYQKRLWFSAGMFNSWTSFSCRIQNFYLLALEQIWVLKWPKIPLMTSLIAIEMDNCKTTFSHLAAVKWQLWWWHWRAAIYSSAFFFTTAEVVVGLVLVVISRLAVCQRAGLAFGWVEGWGRCMVVVHTILILNSQHTCNDELMVVSEPVWQGWAIFHLWKFMTLLSKTDLPYAWRAAAHASVSGLDRAVGF